MKWGLNLPRKAMMALLMAGVTVTILPAPTMAQDDARLRRIEAELRALQRAVFPNSDGRFFTPEVTTPDGSPPPQQIGTPSTTALSDVLLRMDALESQLARLTATTEEQAAAMRELENRLADVESRGVARVEPPTGVIRLPGGQPSGGQSASIAPSAPVGELPPAAPPSAERVAGVQSIAKPATGDAGSDEYTYGFRLWEARYYPEARQQLAMFVENYPRHAQISFGRNLLGRAFLDDGDPRNAATHFLANYQADKQGARAGDSLLFLAEAMIALNDTSRACIALATFGDEYPALAVGRLKSQYDRNRARVTCN